MDPAQLPATIGAVMVTLLGVAVALRPEAIEMVGVSATSPLGRTEVRAVFGGMFIAMGAVCLVTQHPMAYLMAGAMWLADVVIRVFAIVVDKPKLSDGLTVLAIGTVMGAMLLSGFWVR